MVTSVRDYYTQNIPSTVADYIESHRLSEILILVWSMIHDLYENIRNGNGYKGMVVPHDRITLFYRSLLQVFDNAIAKEIKYQQYLQNLAGNGDMTILSSTMMPVDDTVVGVGETTILGSERLFDDIAIRKLANSNDGESINEDEGSLTTTTLTTMLANNCNTGRPKEQVLKKGRREVASKTEISKDKEESHYNNSWNDIVIDGKLYKCCKVKVKEGGTSQTHLWILIN